MSYCRWSECDVYAYDSCEGGVRFYVAGDNGFDRLCRTYNDAYQYAKELRDEHGFDVPLHAIDALREDAIEEAKQHLGPDSAIAEMLADIAKLREDLEFERSENGWAREFLNRMGQKCGTEDCPSLVAYVTKLEVENAKLRKLIGAGTCEADETDLIPFVRADSGDFEVDYIHVMECTECGHTYEHVNGDYEYCPRCGRKRKDVDE